MSRGPDAWDWPDLRSIALREARRILGPDAAEDAAQEASLRAWRAREDFRGGDPSAWMRTIARREALRIAARSTEVPLDAGLEARLSDDGGQLDHVLVRLDALAMLQSVTPLERQTLWLRYWGDLRHPEIAAALREPVGTVKVRIHRARLRLARVAR